MEQVYRNYTCCAHPFSEIHAHLNIRRKPTFYIVNFIIPTVVISIIAAFGFFTPFTSSGERTEKINLGVTTLLAMSVLLMVLSEHMPTTSEFVPLISKSSLNSAESAECWSTGTRLQVQRNWVRILPCLPLCCSSKEKNFP